MIDLKQEKLDQIRQDMLEEQYLRKNFDAAFDKASEDFDLQRAIKDIDDAINWLKSLGWEIDRKYIIEEI